MNKRLVFTAILFAFAIECYYSFSAYGQVPRFEDYPATAIYRGRNAPVKLETEDARMYRTRLRWAVKNQKTNFAGHYIITTWGCGTGCIQFAIIDAKTGRVYLSDFSVCCASSLFGWPDNTERLEFRANSRLLIVNGARNEEGNGTYYYEWKDNGLSLINSVERPKP